MLSPVIRMHLAFPHPIPLQDLRRPLNYTLARTLPSLPLIITSSLRRSVYDAEVKGLADVPTHVERNVQGKKDRERGGRKRFRGEGSREQVAVTRALQVLTDSLAADWSRDASCSGLILAFRIYLEIFILSSSTMHDVLSVLICHTH